MSRTSSGKHRAQRRISTLTGTGLVIGVFLSGCVSTQPSSASLTAVKEQSRFEHYKQCVAHQSRRAPFGSGPGIVEFCRSWAHRQVW